MLSSTSHAIDHLQASTTLRRRFVREQSSSPHVRIDSLQTIYIATRTERNVKGMKQSFSPTLLPAFEFSRRADLSTCTPMAVQSSTANLRHTLPKAHLLHRTNGQQNQHALQQPSQLLPEQIRTTMNKTKRPFG